MNNLNRQCLLLGGILSVLLIVVLSGISYFFLEKKNWLQSQLEYIEPRYSRLKGLESELDNILKLLQVQQNSLNRYLLGSSGDQNQIGNDALQRVRKVLESSGFDINSAQVVVDVKGDGFNKIGLIVKGDSNIASLMTSLSGISDLKPVVFVDSLVVQSTGLSQPHVAQRITVQLNLSMLRGRL